MDNMHCNSTLPSSLEKQIAILEPFVKRYLNSKNPEDKLEIIGGHPFVQEFLKEPCDWYVSFSRHYPEYDLPIKSIIAIGQASIIFNRHNHPYEEAQLLNLMKTLAEIEQFYEPMGGILGYHLAVLKLIYDQENLSPEEGVHYIQPPKIEIGQSNARVRAWIKKGIEHLPEMAEIYPVGGAGDRLSLTDEKTGEALPAARLLFCGRTLLEGLIRDIQAREYLYYKLFAKQVVTPLAMMTSQEKNNHHHIYEICKENRWFGRPEQSFIFFMQPLAPVITKEGNWSLSAPMTLFLKPGGHGVIWKVAEDHGIFSNLRDKNYTKAFVRQINNPIAGIDYALLALAGLGFENKKAFGFASCPRQVNAAEGVDVLVEKKTSQGYQYAISNVEYTEFSKKGIHDAPAEDSSLDSAFPANTNILFVDLSTIQQAVAICPFPGKNINMKNKAPYLSPHGELTEIESGRLETTMQNIADYIVDGFDHPIGEEEKKTLKTYLTYNERRKTISVTKKSYGGKTLAETPEGCFYDLLYNYRDLLVNYCHMKAPLLNNEKEFLEKGPSFIAMIHPAIGPLFSIISQKIRGGSLAEGSEIQLEIAEVDFRDLHLKGSCHIVADTILGQRDAEGMIRYNDSVGKCTLHHVEIINDGIDTAKQHVFWKNKIYRKEMFSLILHGNAEFYAENVKFRGNQHIEVPDGYRMIAKMEGGEVHFRTEKILVPTWAWRYSFTSDNQIVLERL